jgi:hypothetical protein
MQRWVLTVCIFAIGFKTKDMLEQFSWTDYVVGIMVATVVYYAALLVWIKFLTKSRFKYSDAKGDGHRVDAEEDRTPTASTTIETLVNDLNNVFVQHKGKTVSKQALATGIREVLQRSQGLRGSEIEDSIVVYIQAEAEQHCSVRFEDAEVIKMWE